MKPPSSCMAATRRGTTRWRTLPRVRGDNDARPFAMLCACFAACCGGCGTLSAHVLASAVPTLPPAPYSFAGATATIVNDGCMNPWDVVKQRMQVGSSGSPGWSPALRWHSISHWGGGGGTQACGPGESHEQEARQCDQLYSKCTAGLESGLTDMCHAAPRRPAGAALAVPRPDALRGADIPGGGAGRLLQVVLDHGAA